MQYVDPHERLCIDFEAWEFCVSATAKRLGIEIRIVAGSRIHQNLIALVHHVLQPVRTDVGVLHVSSGYRPAHVNTAVGGVPTSQHCDGGAADLWHDTLSPLDLARAFVDRRAAAVPFDQLILEHDSRVVHASHVRATEADRQAGRNPNRGEVLTRYRDGDGQLQYLYGLVAQEDLP